MTSAHGSSSLLLMLIAAAAVEPALAQVRQIEWRPLDAVYSAPLDRLITVSASPSMLHIYDPATAVSNTVSLPYVPTAVTLSPDGRFAAVGHDQWVSWVDLQNRSVVRSINVQTEVKALAVSNAYIYAFPPSGAIRYVPISGGTVSSGPVFDTNGPYRRPVVAQDGSRMYQAISGTTARMDIGPDGALTRQLATVIHCGALFPMDGPRMLTGCASIVTSASLPADDMLYRGSAGERYMASAAFSGARNEVASTAGYTSSEIRLYRADFGSETGRFTLPGLEVSAVKKVPVSARFIFYSADSSRLIVLQQADEASGILHDFGVSVYSFGSACPVAGTQTTSQAPAMGGRGTLNFTTTGACLWQAETSASWLVLNTRSIGGTVSSLNWYAAPNPTSSPRSATIKIGAQSWTVTQAASGPPENVTLLPYIPWDTRYSKPLDRIVIVSADPPQLHLYDAAGRMETRTVDLPGAPFSMGLSPDGLFAAVTLDGAVVRVNLSTGVIDRAYGVSSAYAGVALSQSWMYVFERAKTMRAIDLATGQATVFTSSLRLDWGMLSLDGSFLYTTGDTDDIQSWRLTGGLPSLSKRSTNTGCYRMFTFGDGQRLVNGCGMVLRLSSTPSDDLTYLGSLSTTVDALTYVPGRREVLVSARMGAYRSTAEVQRFTSDALAILPPIPTPMMVDATGALVAGQAINAFSSAAEDRVYLLLLSGERYGNGPEPTFGVTTVPYPEILPCTYTVSPRQIALPQAGGIDARVQVQTQASCAWDVSSADWLTVSQSARIGSGTITLSGAAANTTGALRSVTLAAAGQTITVVQKSLAECSIELPDEVVVMQPSSSRDLYVAGTPGCVFPVSTPAGSFLTGLAATVTSNSNLRLNLTFSPTTETRSTIVNIGGRAIKVTNAFTSSCVLVTGGTIQTPAAGITATMSLSQSGWTCGGRWKLIHAPPWMSIYPTQGAVPQTVPYTVYPNYSSQSRQGILQFEGQAFITLTQPGSGAIPDARFIGRTYFAALGRNPTQSEVDFQVNNALAKGGSRADLATSFLSSAEFDASSRYVAGLYVGLLARNAELAGWLFQRNALLTNVASPLQLTSNFLYSAEFQSRNGDLNNAAFVRLMYRNILLREATQAEVDYHAAALTYGISRVNIAHNFLSSAEFRQGNGPRITAFLLYAALLGRDPLPPELAQTMARVSSGVPLKVLVEEILAGYEFGAQVN